MGVPSSVPASSRSPLDELVVSAQAGSRQALDALIEALSATLWREFRAQRHALPVGPSRGRSDLIQDTLIRARECFGRFEQRSFADFRRWAGGILRKRQLECARNHRNRNNRQLYEKIWHSIRQRVETQPHGSRPDEALEWRQNAARVAELFEGLRVDEQFIINLRLFKGCSYPHIAHMTGCTPDAARKAYDRAISRLADQFSFHGDASA